MSATGRGSARHPDDFYASPSWCVRAILPHLRPFRTVLDPCAGDGAILNVVRPLVGANAFGLEIDPERAAASGSTCADALDPSTSWAPAPDLIITNPPFDLAMEFVVRALHEIASGGEVVMLFRIAWLCSTKRKPFHRKHPSDLFPLPRRPEFAASVKCARGKALGGPCGWKVMLPISAPRPSACPDCASKVTTNTSDSADYAWFAFSAERGNRWTLL